MKYLKYPFFIVLIILAELILVYGMFVFVSASKLLFILASLLLIAGVVVYLVVSRHREKTKIKPKSEVWEGYIKVGFVVIVSFILSLAATILIRGLVFLIRRV